ncbi:MAG TPA: aminotransferase class III-fold pyridoxal phosphate-dependent enzyme [Dehalococcoidia bacterium]|jgi:glutamate-1-semialdehyde 2,1-aminomutase|nr:aminotransferase class III-fold pyridoxal phosphate-dependent enzyme [Dehalococcoidia bacterium]
MTYDLTQSYELFERAERVIPGGIYGTRSPRFATFGEFPAFIRSAKGCRLTDVDGNEYIDFMCGFAPIVLGYNHPFVQRAIVEQESRGNAASIPFDRTVELAEALIARFPFAGWAMFGKNGSDVTTLATRVARAHTGQAKLLVAEGAYHGFDSWSNPDATGIPAAHRTELDSFVWNDITSVHDCFDRNRGEVAAVMICPIKHDAMHDIETPLPEFFAAIQEGLDDERALLIVDDVRCGFRLHPSGASHARFGLNPDLVCFGKAISNGQPISVLAGREELRETAKSLYFSATYFFSAAPMAAALATMEAFDSEGAYEQMQGAGHLLRRGITKAAKDARVGIRYSGPDVMPNLIFKDDPKFRRGRRFSGLAARRGVIFHPRHNWFLSAAHTPDDIAEAVSVAHECFEIVAKEIESGAL